MSFGDIFVYPDLRWLKPPGEDQRFAKVVDKQIPEFVLDQQYVLIAGPEKSGKTTLAKALFQDLRVKGVVPVYLIGSEIKGKGYNESSVLSSVKHAFEAQYSMPNEEGFRQEEKTKKAIIIDDFDRMRANARGRDRVLKTLKESFGMIVLLGSEQLRFDDLIDQEEGTKPIIWSFAQCNILPFGRVRRAALVERWCTLGRQYTCDEHELSRRAQLAERTIDILLGQGFVPAYPLFILVMLQQLEVSTPLNMAPVSGSYGYVYEALLTMALTKATGRSDDLDTQYNYLSEFAYLLFKEQTYHVEVGKALKWHDEYCEMYSLHLDFENHLSILCDALVLNRENETIGFRYPYGYYYFVSRYFSDHINELAIREHIRLMSKQLNHADSANIMMFLSYKSRDPYILESMLEASRDLFSSYEEYDLVEHTQFLERLADSLPRLHLDSSDPEAHRREVLAREDDLDEVWTEEEQEMGERPINLDRDLGEILQINVAFKTIQILGQVLRNYHGSLKGELKLDLARECYSLGLRVLTFMFNLVESELEDLIKFFVDMSLSAEAEKKSPEDIVKYAGKFIFCLMEALAFATIKQISDSVGLDKLCLTFDDLLIQNTLISYRFIDLSVRLDYCRGFPKKQVFDMDRDTRRRAFAARLLRDLVWYHFYIHRESRRLRESVCARLDIKLLPSTVQDERVKRVR